MHRFKSLSRALTSFLFLVLLLSGCATFDQQVSLNYVPFVKASGGSGELFVTTSAPQSGMGLKNEPVKWIIGEVKDGDGQKLRDIMTATPPGILLLTAFVQELQAAGYTVKLVNALPPDVARGLDFSGVELRMAGTQSLMSLDAESTASVAVVVWKGGTRQKTYKYEASYFDRAIIDRRDIYSSTLQNSAQSLIKRALPELMKALEP